MQNLSSTSKIDISSTGVATTSTKGEHHVEDELDTCFESVCVVRCMSIVCKTNGYVCLKLYILEEAVRWMGNVFFANSHWLTKK